jgi:hypothetical protein
MGAVVPLGTLKQLTLQQLLQNFISIEQTLSYEMKENIFVL